jgi:NAD(P)-dependent dehydrogenase (short-subunit alcohol dehydrogenase family)
MERNHLVDKVAMVTRAAGGVGRAVALRLAQDGADLVIHHEADEDGARAVAAEVEALGRKATVVQASLNDADSIRAMTATVAADNPQLHVLVHSAGHGASGPLTTLDFDDWRETLDVNATAMLLLVQGVLPGLKAAGGADVIAISNEGSRSCFSDYGASGTAKAALEALCRNLAFELVHDGIRVNILIAGPTETPGNARLGYPPAVYAFGEKKSPQGRLGRPDDLAGTVSFLCSADAGWILGQTVVVDGGLTLGVDFRDWLD